MKFMEFDKKLEEYFRDLEKQDLFSGVALITHNRSEEFSGAYGYANRAWKIPNTMNTRFDIASITKLFTAICVLQLIDQDQLTFNIAVVDFLGLENTAISQDVNVFHLLTHSSGIGDDCEEEAGEVYEDLWKLKANYSVTETVHFLPQFFHKPANFPPGRGCRYCNCSFVLLGLIIEIISGLSYREYVQRNIFDSVGMIHSGFFRLDRANENTAEGSDPLRDESGNIVGWKKNIYSFPPIGSPDSGAYVTAYDLIDFINAVQSGRLISSDLVKALTTPQVLHCESEEERWMFSYVLEFLLDAHGQIIFYQKDGVNAGVSAILRHYPDQDINVVLLSNMEDGVWEPIRKIHHFITKDKKKVGK